MTAKDAVDEVLDNYRGDDLQAVLIGSDYWSDFLAQAGLAPKPVGTSDSEVIYRNVSCREGVVPDRISLLTGR